MNAKDIIKAAIEIGKGLSDEENVEDNSNFKCLVSLVENYGKPPKMKIMDLLFKPSEIRTMELMNRISDRPVLHIPHLNPPDKQSGHFLPPNTDLKDSKFYIMSKEELDKKRIKGYKPYL